MRRLALHGAIVILLTVLTQLGGMVWLVCVALGRLVGRRHLLWPTVAFLGLYPVASLTASSLAPAFGRVALPCLSTQDSSYRLASPIYCLLNRNYVTPDLLTALEALSAHLATEYPGTVTMVLDANFPFLDGFPLLPHLSHDDGTKLDIAFFYAPRGVYSPGAIRSPIGYFAFETPTSGDPGACAGRNDIFTLRWNFDWLQGILPAMPVDVARTSAALRWLVDAGGNYGVKKVFIEPHLAENYGIAGDRLRFQGCRAARHDDHIHFEVR